MIVNDLRNAYESKPFRPFVVCLTDGREIPVYSRDSIKLPPEGSRLVITQPDGSFQIIDSSCAARLEFADQLRKTKKRAEAVTIEQVKRLYEAQPFQPFIIHLASGREVAVPHREFMWAAPSGRTIFVELPDESVDIIDLLLVTDIVRMPMSNGTGTKKRKK